MLLLVLATKVRVLLKLVGKGGRSGSKWWYMGCNEARQSAILISWLID